MGSVMIQNYTCKNPITMIGFEAGICWGADTADEKKNYRRGLDCLESGHGRTFEFPDVYLTLEGYSARVIREWYTHIGGSAAKAVYDELMAEIQKHLARLDELGVPREDSAMGLPLGMETRIVCKHNLRNLMDMSRQRMCCRAYHEYRALFSDLCRELSGYSEEWDYTVSHYFMPKCRAIGFCPEKHSCGRMPPRE